MCERKGADFCEAAVGALTSLCCCLVDSSRVFTYVLGFVEKLSFISVRVNWLEAFSW